MENKILQVFSDYIQTHNIGENTQIDIQDIGYVTFFNDITEHCLGLPLFTHDKFHESSTSMVYMPDDVKDKFIPDMDIIAVNALYIGIFSNGNIEFNYPNYPDFIKALKTVRLQCKKENKTVEQYMIKIYLNIIYGMINKAESIVTAKNNPREYVTTTAKSVMLTIASFLLNKRLPVYHINTDEIFVKSLDGDTRTQLIKFYETECSKLIDISISSLDLEDNHGSCIIQNKKRFITNFGGQTRNNGIAQVDDEKILKKNKEYFGRNYQDIFPEYRI